MALEVDHVVEQVQERVVAGQVVDDLVVLDLQLGGGWPGCCGT